MDYPNTVSDARVSEVLGALATQHGVAVPTWVRCNLHDNPEGFIDRYNVCGGVMGPSYALFSQSPVALGLGPSVHEGDILHEFTHYLLHLEGARFPTNDAAHRETFYARLVGVAAGFYGDATAYPWTRDYPHIRAWARRDGHMK